MDFEFESRVAIVAIEEQLNRLERCNKFIAIDILNEAILFLDGFQIRGQL